MENHFAGSRNQGERRRRHLANDQRDGVQGDVDATMLAEFATQDVLNEGRIASPETIGVLARVLPKSVWPYPTMLATIAGLIVSLYASGQQALTENVAGLLLLFGSQLALLIGLLRETSDIDFRGRYRWWAGLSLAGFVVAVLMLTNALDHVPSLVVLAAERITGPIHAARPALVVVPCVAVSVLLLSRIIPDMGRCRVSQAVFVTATLTAVVRQMLIFTEAGDSATEGRTLEMLLVSSSYLVFAALLIHSRFVAYVCNDPPVTGTPAQKPVKAPAAETIAIPAQKPKATEPAEAKPSAKQKTKRTARRSRKKAA